MVTALKKSDASLAALTANNAFAGRRLSRPSSVHAGIFTWLDLVQGLARKSQVL